MPGFALHIRKFGEQITIKACAKSTVFSYSRSIAQISLYFRKSPLDLEPDEINFYLFTLKQDKDLSDTFFNSAGLRVSKVCKLKITSENPKTVVEYLGRYTHKVAISNHRLRMVDQENVTLAYKEYRQDGKQKQIKLTGTEFLRSFSSHNLSRESGSFRLPLSGYDIMGSWHLETRARS